MVWPLVLLAAGGTGMQMLGGDQRTQAEKTALAVYNQYLKRINAEQGIRDKQLNVDLGQISDAYNADVASFVNVFNPGSRVNSYQQGNEQALTGIRQALAQTNAGNPIYPARAGQGASGPTGAFASSLGQAQDLANTRTGQMSAAAAVPQALNAMGQRETTLSGLFSERSQVNNQRVTDAQRVYQLGNALREKALAQAAGQNGLDMQRAQGAGAGAMLLGGLMQGGAQVGGYYYGQNAAKTA